MKNIIFNSPNPKQADFFRADTRHIAYGGARGGGKSWAMRVKLVALALRYPGLQELLLRRTFKELRGNHVIPLLQMLQDKAKYNNAEHEFWFSNGSRLKLGFCSMEDDVYQYQGQEYDVIGMEEATHFTESQMIFLTTCNRPTLDGFKPRMYYTCNPGNVGHAWIKRLFIDRNYRETEDPEDYTFIQANVFDNTVLMERDPGYVRTLSNMPEELRRMHLYGDWDVTEGQYFNEFRREKHVVKPFPIPEHWRRFRSMDWGYKDPCCVLWHAADEEGRVYTYRELYVRGRLPSAVAKLSEELSQGEEIRYTAASPDAWQKRGMLGDIGGESIAEVFARAGMPLVKADSSRVVGWMRIREYMADAPDGIPWWQCFDTCANLIRTLPLMIHDAHYAEDIADGLEDHACESLRYGLMSRPQRAVFTDDAVKKGMDFDEQVGIFLEHDI